MKDRPGIFHQLAGIGLTPVSMISSVLFVCVYQSTSLYCDEAEAGMNGDCSRGTSAHHLEPVPL